jgi:hypothetical protein
VGIAQPGCPQRAPACHPGLPEAACRPPGARRARSTHSQPARAKDGLPGRVGVRAGPGHEPRRPPASQPARARVAALDLPGPGQRAGHGGGQRDQDQDAARGRHGDQHAAGAGDGQLGAAVPGGRLPGAGGCWGWGSSLAGAAGRRLGWGAADCVHRGSGCRLPARGGAVACGVVARVSHAGVCAASV